jgi:hypothetical protein
MVFNEQEYAENEYDGLVRNLLQSQDWDAELQYRFLDSVMLKNPNFFLNLFQEVGKIRVAATQSNALDMVSSLNRLEAKLYEYTDVIPADLPESILRDKYLIGYCLTEQLSATIQSKWDVFQKYITEKLNEISQKFQLPFLKWCVQMLNMNLGRHLKKGGQVHVKDGFDRRLQYLEKLIEERIPTHFEPVQIEVKNTELMPKSKNKIQWLGTQKELAELFIRLRAKGWIADFEPETIKDCFTNANSIQQLLKPGEYTEDLGGTFEQVLTPEYIPKFHGIFFNPKRDN